MKHQKQQQEKFEALIRDLERDLAEGKSQVAALEETHKRLQESERICQGLADENRRLGEELAGWQERFAKSEESRRQVSMLRRQIETLQAEHAQVVDRNREIEEKLRASSDAGKISSAVADDPTGARLTPELSRSDKTGGYLLGSGASALTADLTKAARWIVRNRRVGAVFAGVIVAAIMGAVTVKKILISKAPVSRVPIVIPPEETAVRVPEAVSKPPINTSSRIRGVFQTVRATQVFSKPSEDSALVANIGKGTKVNVVNSADGWLEIRSKHGRPPGFIRKEATERIGSN